MRCKKFASALHIAGYNKGDTIGFLAMNTPELFEAHYSVPMAGMILNAMNYRLDHKNLAYIIDHSELKILFSDLEFLDVAPSSAQLVGAEIELVSLFSRERMLKEALEDVNGKYKYVIIDSPPSLGLLTINVLTAANTLIIPIQCEYYALEGLSQLLNTIRMVQKHLNTALEIEGILITMYDHRLNLSRQVVQELNEYFGDKVYKTFIKRNVRLGEAPSHGKPILLYDATSTGAQNYMDLVTELLLQNG